MTRYDKSEIRKGMVLELVCPIRTYTRPRALAEEINARLDSARARLEDLVKEIRNARR
jgi:hypothetical protein